MKVFVSLDRNNIEKQLAANPKADPLGNTLVALREAGLKPSSRQPLMEIHFVYCGEAEPEVVLAVRKIQNVITVRRADGKKMKVK